MEETEIVRRCAFAVAVATGVDPYDHQDVVRGDDQLQVARRLWAHLVAVEFGINHTQAARLIDRTRRSVIINLSEIADWADPEMHPRGNQFGWALENMGEALRALLHEGLAVAKAAPTPIERSKINRKRAQARA